MYKVRLVQVYPYAKYNQMPCQGFNQAPAGSHNTRVVKKDEEDNQLW